MKHAPQVKIEQIVLEGYSTCDCCSKTGPGIQIHSNCYSSMRLCKLCVTSMKESFDGEDEE
ncbi:hypothetical protein VPHD479_0327 [Vibrio phage D479]